MTTAQSHSSPPRNRKIALNKTGSAAASIGRVHSGMEIFSLTFGQFSLIDAIEHLVSEAGPCEVVVSTWTAAVADAQRASKLLKDGNISRFRLLVDRPSLPASRNTAPRWSGCSGIRQSAQLGHTPSLRSSKTKISRFASGHR